MELRLFFRNPAILEARGGFIISAFRDLSLAGRRTILFESSFFIHFFPLFLSFFFIIDVGQM